jgi:hypothetical protein
MCLASCSEEIRRYARDKGDVRRTAHNPATADRQPGDDVRQPYRPVPLAALVAASQKSSRDPGCSPSTRRVDAVVLYGAESSTAY